MLPLGGPVSPVSRSQVLPSAGTRIDLDNVNATALGLENSLLKILDDGDKEKRQRSLFHNMLCKVVL